MLESKFQASLKEELENVYLPGCIVLKNDANLRQGFPDLLILFGDRWAALEVKVSATAPFQPNQRWWIDTLSNMAYAGIIYPENKEEIIVQVQHALRTPRSSRISQRQ